MREEDSTVEATMAALAGDAFGVTTRAELLTAGVSDREIEWRRGSGALIDEHRGTYRVGHSAPSVEATYMGAVRACGKETLLAGLAAGFVYKLVRGSAPEPEVIALTERQVPGVITHRARRQPGADASVYHGIPITSVARTLVDLAAVLSEEALAWACHQAGIRYGTTPAQVEAVLRRRPASKGAGKLRRIMSGDTKVTLSKLEKAFLGRLREAGLPLPTTNRPAGGRRVDCRWPEHRLTVELDGYRYHRSRHAWEQDRRRAREARARGDEFRRYTYGDVLEEPRPMMRELIEYFSTSRPG